MPASYCTRCGQPLDPPVRYCRHCGAPVHSMDAAAVRGSSPVPDMVAGESESPYSVGQDTLNTLLSCALGNAPLDTEFLLLGDKKNTWAGMIPLEFIRELQGVAVLGSATVRFSLRGVNFSYVRNCLHDMVSEEVRQAYLSALEGPTLHIDVIAHFNAKECAEMEKSEIAGKWVNCAEGDENAGVRLVATDTHSPLSGFLFKKNLGKFEAWFSESQSKIGVGTNEARKVLDSVRSAMKQIPDDIMPNLRCLAFMVNPDGRRVNTFLSEDKDEEPDKDEATASPAIMAKGLARRPDLFSPQEKQRQATTERLLSKMTALGVLKSYGAFGVFRPPDRPIDAKRKW